MMDPQNPSSKSKTLAYFRWGGSILSLGLFIWLISRQNWTVVLHKTAGIGAWLPAAAIGLQLASTLLNVARWYVYLRAVEVRISYWRATRLAWAAYFASNFLPSTIGGDTIRMLAMLVYTGNKAIAFGSVVLDRVTNMAAMACLLPVSGTVVGFGSATASAIGAIPGGLRRFFDGFLSEVREAVHTWVGHPWSFALAFFVAWPSNLIPMLTTYLVARQLGIEVTYWQVIGVQTLTYFISLLPISISGYGVREVAYTALYVSLGASIEQASTLALMTRFFMMVATLPGALWMGEAVRGTRGSRVESRN